MTELKLDAKVNTSAEHHITPAAESEPDFDEKNELFWNGTLRNTHIKQSNGFPTTSGQTVRIEAYKGIKDGEEQEGISLVAENTTLNLPYKTVLLKHFKCRPKAAGKQIAHAYWNNRILTLYKDSQQSYIIVETNDKDELIKTIKLDCASAMFSSVNKLDDQPIIFLNKKTKHSATEYENHVSVYNLFDYFDFDNTQPKYEYILNDAIYATLLRLDQEKGDQLEIVEQAYNNYRNLLASYDNGGNADLEKRVNESYSNYLLELNKYTDLEKQYRELSWQYDYRNEVEWCEEQIDVNKTLNKSLQEELDNLNEDNQQTIDKQTTLEANITKLNEHLTQDYDKLYSMKAPALSEEATKIKATLDNKLLASKKEFDTEDSKYIQSVKKYRNMLNSYQETINWSWAMSSTSSRSGSYKFDGHRANLLLPVNNYIFGRAVALNETLFININQTGTFGGYGGAQDSSIRFSTNSKNTTKLTWYNNDTSGYGNGNLLNLNEHDKDKLGFNYKIISNYSDLVKNYNSYTEALNKYNSDKAEYDKQMNSNVELAAYMRFVNSYDSLQLHIDEEKLQIEKLQQSLNELEADTITYQERKIYLEDSIKKISNKLIELEKQLKRAEINVSNMDKREVLDDNGSVVYQELDPIFVHDTKDGVPLGDAHSGTMFIDSDDNKHIVIGFDDDDKNRSLTLHYDTHTKNYKEYKWFGCVSVDGTITGEPIPDPDVFTDWIRRSNGTYQINMRDARDRYIKGTIIGGYEWSSNKYNKIEIESFTNNESVRTNISANDTLTDDEKKDKKPDPKIYFISNFADSRGIYYDYGPGWIKCYIRKISLSSNVIKDCYIYTYGSVNKSNLRSRKESVMAKGKTKEWPFDSGKLNKRIYTVGGTNKADDSLLAILPFSVQVTPDEKINEQTLPGLRMQMFGLLPLSFSFRTSLVSNGEEHTDQFQVAISKDEKTIILSTLSMIYIIKKTSDKKDFRIWKTADYYFQTNILDKENVIVEDRNGNLSVERGSIPYCEECVLDIEDKNLTIPEAKELVTNNTWYWAASYNPFFLNTANSSYILPAISLPLYVNSEQLETFQDETLEQRGSILKPMLKGLFNEYEGVDVFYTVATVTTTLYYKTTHIVKTSDINEDDYDVYGKETYNVDMANTTYAVATNTQYFPIAVGSVVEGINYITPTIELENEYAVRLYNNSNKVYGGYQYASRIFNGTNVFTIYGRNYYYDKQGIYFIGTSDTYTSNQFVCYVLGMEYLASSGSEAYFYSSYDKQIYIFTGSNTLQRMQYVSNQGNIIDSLFSSHEQILYLLTDEGKLILMNEKDTCILDVPNFSKDIHLEGTNIGCAVINDMDSFTIFSPYKELDDITEFRLRTGYIGNNSNLTKLSHFDLVLFKLTDKPITIDLEVNTLNGIEKHAEHKSVTISPNMWKGTSYRIRYSPQNNVGNSFQIGCSSKDYMALAYFGIEANTLSNTQGAARNTATAAANGAIRN